MRYIAIEETEANFNRELPNMTMVDRYHEGSSFVFGETYMYRHHETGDLWLMYICCGMGGGKTEYYRYVEEQENQEIKSERQIKVDEAEQAKINAEYQYAVQHHPKVYSITPCPYCGHYKVYDVEWEKESMYTAFWGTGSENRKNHQCGHCKRLWK